MEIGKIEQLTTDAIDAITERKKAVRPASKEDLRRVIGSLALILKRMPEQDIREVLQGLVVK